ncbi:MAG TPA: GNAT family N-acetyltransferase [Steroidobacteraceae bacterium]|nr:GNAT family N-acetyltransferase [Steroidobacteraceae bacterium]
MADLRTLQLETPRLLLRPLRLEDFEPWARFMDDEVATRFIGGRQLRATAWRGFMTMCGCWHMTGIAMFSVIEKSTGEWIGRLGPWYPESWPDPEVGWGIVREHWGKGYASEGAAAAMDYACDVLGWEHVIHCIDENNAGSQGVARKLGSRLLRRVTMPFPFESQPVDAWGQSREEWRRSAVRRRLLGLG